MAGQTALSSQMMTVSNYPPPVNSVNTSATRQSQLAAMSEFAKFKEEIANMMKNKLGIDMGNPRLYQKTLSRRF